MHHDHTFGWLDLQIDAESACLPQHKTGTRCSDRNWDTTRISSSVTDAGTTRTEGYDPHNSCWALRCVLLPTHDSFAEHTEG